MGGGQLFLKNLCDTTFKKDLSNEPNFGRIHLAEQYLYHTSEKSLSKTPLSTLFRTSKSSDFERRNNREKKTVYAKILNKPVYHY
jgi:hypothetical protein